MVFVWVNEYCVMKSNKSVIMYLHIGEEFKIKNYWFKILLAKETTSDFNKAQR
jgi:hypothetical protein